MALHKSLVSSGNNFGRQLLARRIALHRHASRRERGPFRDRNPVCRVVPLNPNSVIDLDYEETDVDLALRRFFFYPGSHDKITRLPAFALERGCPIGYCQGRGNVVWWSAASARPAIRNKQWPGEVCQLPCPKPRSPKSSFTFIQPQAIQLSTKTAI